MLPRDIAKYSRQPRVLVNALVERPVDRGYPLAKDVMIHERVSSVHDQDLS